MYLMHLSLLGLLIWTFHIKLEIDLMWI